jgi:hypothetical protein
MVPLPDRLGPTGMKIFCCDVSPDRMYPKNSASVSIEDVSSPGGWQSLVVSSSA